MTPFSENEIRKMVEGNPETKSMLDFNKARNEDRTGFDKVMDTKTLLRINQNSINANYNRLLDPEELEKTLDPKGWHVLTPIMIHEHRNGARCAPHYRCIVYIKVKDSTEPVQIFLDISLPDFLPLPSTREWDAMRRARH